MLIMCLLIYYCIKYMCETNSFCFKIVIVFAAVTIICDGTARWTYRYISVDYWIDNKLIVKMLFLGHLSYCGQWLSVVRRASTFDLYTVETTFVIRFLWNLVRMFVLTISRPSSNMGHVVSKSRSPGQILRNSCLLLRDHICNPILINFDQSVCLSNI